MANLVLNQIKAFEETMVAWRHDLHMHPEIGFEEHRTYDNIARTLAGIGYEVHRNVGRRESLVAWLSGTPSARLVSAPIWPRFRSKRPTSSAIARPSRAHACLRP